MAIESEGARAAQTAETFIDGCAILQQTDAAARGRLAAMAKLVRYEAGARIFEQGDTIPGLFIVGSGLVRVFKLSPAGKEHALHLAGPGETFAEVALLGGFDAPANAQALEPTRCVLLPKEPFLRALREEPQLSMQLLTGLSLWVRRLVNLLEDIVLRDATGRVASYLVSAAKARDGRVALPSLKKHLASHLNLTSETLSRALRRLEEEGAIAKDGRHLLVTNGSLLAQLASGEGDDA